jgi:hypothetical protein
MQRGIKVTEVNVSQRKEDTQVRLARPGVYLRRILDILTLFFLVRFTKKPVRFFGLVATFLFLAVLMITVCLGVLRFFSTIELSNRALLLLGISVMVIGIQAFSVALVGQLTLFSHPTEISDFKIEEITE